MQRMKLLIISLISLALLTSCGVATNKPQGTALASPPVVIEKAVPIQVPLAVRPEIPNLTPPRIKVINGGNYKEFFETYLVKDPKASYVAITVKDYERLSVNLAKLKAYASQQNDVIRYYEEALR